MRRMHIKHSIPFKRVEKSIDFRKERFRLVLAEYPDDLVRLKGNLAKGFTDESKIKGFLFHTNYELLWKYDYLYRDTGAIEDWQVAMRALSVMEQIFQFNIMRFALKPNETKRVTIEGFDFLCEPATFCHYNNWLANVYFSVAMRNQRDVETLLNIDPKLFDAYKYPHDEYPDYSAHVFKILRALIYQDTDAGPLIEHYQTAYPRYMVHERSRHIFDPWYCVVQGDKKGYEQAMRKVSKLHRSAERRDLLFTSERIMGSYPGELIAAACIAYDQHQWRLDHTNDYVLDWWYDTALRETGYQYPL